MYKCAVHKLFIIEQELLLIFRRSSQNSFFFFLFFFDSSWQCPRWSIVVGGVYMWNMEITEGQIKSNYRQVLFSCVRTANTSACFIVSRTKLLNGFLSPRALDRLNVTWRSNCSGFFFVYFREIFNSIGFHFCSFDSCSLDGDGTGNQYSLERALLSIFREVLVFKAFWSLSWMLKVSEWDELKIIWISCSSAKLSANFCIITLAYWRRKLALTCEFATLLKSGTTQTFQGMSIGETNELHVHPSFVLFFCYFTRVHEAFGSDKRFFRELHVIEMFIQLIRKSENSRDFIAVECFKRKKNLAWCCACLWEYQE